jgi:hypothetical protein
MAWGETTAFHVLGCSEELIKDIEGKIITRLRPDSCCCTTLHEKITLSKSSYFPEMHYRTKFRISLLIIICVASALQIRGATMLISMMAGNPEQ